MRSAAQAEEGVPGLGDQEPRLGTVALSSMSHGIAARVAAELSAAAFAICSLLMKEAAERKAALAVVGVPGLVAQCRGPVLLVLPTRRSCSWRIRRSRSSFELSKSTSALSRCADWTRTYISGRFGRRRR